MSSYGDIVCVFFFQAEDGIRDLVRSRGLGDVYKRQKVIRSSFSLLLSPVMRPKSYRTPSQSRVPEVVAAVRGGAVGVTGARETGAPVAGAAVVAGTATMLVTTTTVVAGASAAVVEADVSLPTSLPQPAIRPTPHIRRTTAAEVRMRCVTPSTVSYTHLTLPTSDLV